MKLLFEEQFSPDSEDILSRLENSRMRDWDYEKYTSEFNSLASRLG